MTLFSIRRFSLSIKKVFQIIFFLLQGTTFSMGICIKHLLSLDRNKNSSNNSLKRSLLQLPPRDPKLVKSSPGRGSWPGPNISGSSTNLLTTEFSKSEQQLPSGQFARKGSNTSNVSTSSEAAKSSKPGSNSGTSLGKI